MRLNSVLPSVLSSAAVVGLAIGVVVEHRSRLRLGEEHQALKQQLQQMTGLIARNEQWSNLVAGATPAPSLPDEQARELLRLRGEVGVLRQQTRELEMARAGLESSRKGTGAGGAIAAATADYWPREAWTFTGYASPDAALQTSLWAANNGDLKVLAASATGEVQKLMEAEFGGRSEAEAMARAMDHVISLKSVRILNREVQGEDTVVLTAAFEGRTDTQTGKLVMKRVGNEWKLSALPQ